MIKSFKERAKLVWDNFEANEHEIRTLIDDINIENTPEKSDRLVNFVNEVLSVGFEDVNFELGENGENKYELIFTPDGCRARLYQLQYLLKHTPSYLHETWNFYSSKPGLSKDSLFMYGVDILENDVELYYEIDKNRQKVNLEIICSKLMALDEDARYNMFFVYLNGCIGDLYEMEYIGYVDFVEGKSNMQKIPYDQFKAMIDYTIEEENWTKPEDLMSMCMIYECEGKSYDGGNNWQLRDDIYIGATSCVPVVNSFLKRENDLVKSFENEGVVFGFLFYDNTQVSKDRIVEFRVQIQDEIIMDAETQDVANVIGGATGLHYSYMDFIIYDLDAFLAIAKEVLAKYKFKEAGFSNFIFGDTPMFFKG